MESLRRLGYTESIILIGEEPHRPYDRPPLSKQFLAGEWEPSRLELPSGQGLDDPDIDLRLGERASSLDLSQRTVGLASGSSVAFDGLIIATGARPRTFPDAPDLAGLHTLRTIEDSLAIRRALAAGARLVVVGAGFIGSEVAATARRSGTDVTLVEALPVPLSRVLGREVGLRCADLHRRHGVDLRLGVGVKAIEGEGRVERVRLSDETAIEAELVVVGIGVRPNTEWLEGSGLVLDDGVVCDETLRADDEIFAAGDVARYPSPLGGSERIEHWTNATAQGHAAAENLLAAPGEARPFAAVPYFWSDQYDVKIQLLGRTGGADEVRIVHGDPEGLRFVALYRAGDRLLGVVTFDMARSFVPYRALLSRGASWEEALVQAAKIETSARS